MRRFSSAMVMALLIGVSACGGGGGTTTNPSAPSPTPTPTPTPTPPPPPTNRPPVISALTVNPTWGVSTLTTHAFSATASDPDGDPITYSWDFGNGTTSTSAAPTVTFNNANTATYRVTLTVNDSKGATTKFATASSSVSVVSTTMAGTWTGTMPDIGPITMSMTQYLGGLVTGTWDIPSRGYRGEIGPSGEPGKVQANGQFELRFKVRVGSFIDFYYRGTMDPTGQRLTGTLHGSGFTGQVMEVIKQ